MLIVLLIQVVMELSSLGLNASMLQALVSGGERPPNPDHDVSAYLQYEFAGTSTA